MALLDKYRDEILELLHRYASHKEIHQMLEERHGVTVSPTTLRMYLRILEKPPQPQRELTPADAALVFVAENLLKAFPDISAVGIEQIQCFLIKYESLYPVIVTSAVREYAVRFMEREETAMRGVFKELPEA